MYCSLEEAFGEIKHIPKSDCENVIDHISTCYSCKEILLQNLRELNSETMIYHKRGNDKSNNESIFLIIISILFLIVLTRT